MPRCSVNNGSRANNSSAVGSDCCILSKPLSTRPFSSSSFSAASFLTEPSACCAADSSSRAPEIERVVANSRPVKLRLLIMPLPSNSGISSRSATACPNSTKFSIGASELATCTFSISTASGLKLSFTSPTSTFAPAAWLPKVSMLYLMIGPAANIQPSTNKAKITIKVNKPDQRIHCFILLSLFR